MPQPIDTALWREAMGGFLTGVTVVTTTSGGKIAGTAVNAFSAVSQDPPLLLVCLDRGSRSLEAIRASGFFAVNILSDAHMDVVRRFASKSADDRFRDVDYSATTTGAPILGGSVAWFDCQVHAIHEGGDHEIVVGHVLEVGSDKAAAPLAYHRGNIWCLDPGEPVPEGHP